jgi:hypothetical protein
MLIFNQCIRYKIKSLGFDRFHHVILSSTVNIKILCSWNVLNFKMNIHRDVLIHSESVGFGS